MELAEAVRIGQIGTTKDGFKGYTRWRNQLLNQIKEREDDTGLTVFEKLKKQKTNRVVTVFDKIKGV